MASCASRQLGTFRTGVAEALQHLAIGRITKPPRSGAPGISDRLGVAMRRGRQVERNLYDGLRYMHTVAAALEELLQVLRRMAASADPAGLASVMAAVLETTEFNGCAVFSPLGKPTSVGQSFAVVFPVEATHGHSSFTLDLPVTPGPIAAPADPVAAGLAIDRALESVGAAHAAAADSVQRLAHAADLLGVQVENFTAAHRQLQDATYAEEIVNLTRFQLLNYSSIRLARVSGQASWQILALLQNVQSDPLGRQDNSEGTLQVVTP